MRAGDAAIADRTAMPAPPTDRLGKPPARRAATAFGAAW